MTSTASKRSLKRLSLLQSSPSTSTTTDAYESESFRGADEAGPSSAPLPIQRSPSSAASEFSTPERAFNERPSSSSKSLKNARRQSSICYFSPDRESSPLASPSLRNSSRFSSQHAQLENEVTQRDVAEKRKKERRRASVQVLQRPPGGETCNEPSGLVNSSRVAQDNQETLTLAERHADLLRFIAQKESKCLELRQQLAVHEAELAQLKRTWTRIVTRGITSSSGSGSPSTSGAPSLGLHSTEHLDDVSLFSVNAIRESVQGVGRLLAQLGDLGAQGLPPDVLHPIPSSSSEVVENEESHRTNRMHASNASISASSASSSFASSTRLSQSSLSLSLSSIGESLPDDEPSAPQDKIRSAPEVSDEIMEDVSDVRVPQKAKTTNSSRSDVDAMANSHTIAISGTLHSARPIRRKPYESSSPSESTDSLSPLTPNSAPPLSRSFSLKNANAGHRVRTTDAQAQKPRQPGRATGPTPRTAGANFPSPASMPGLNAFATVSAIPLQQPLSALVDTVGRKLGQRLQLHAQAAPPSPLAAAPSSSTSTATVSPSGHAASGSGPTSASKFTTAVHRRASTLLSGASSSLFAALSPTLAPVADANKPATRAVRPVASRVSPAATSLLDEDDEDIGGHPVAQWDAVLSPDRPKLPSTGLKGSLISSTPTASDSKSVSDESEDWNW